MVKAELRAAVPADDAYLYRILRYHMGWIDEYGKPSNATEGKGLRPALCFLACEAVGGLPEMATPAAAALELVHNFSLMHDDIQDRDRERHHRPTVWALWGEPQALSAGNAMYALARKTLLGLAERGVAPEQVLQASMRLTQSSLEMIKGQYLDLEFEKRLDVTTDEYLDMTAFKTGALIACSLELGALVGSGDPGLVSAVAEAGRYLGHLFQVRDDVLGVWGDVAATGKTTGSDIMRKKKTFPVIHALQHATGMELTTLHNVYKKAAPSENDVQQVLEVLEATGARQEAEGLATRFGQQALEAIWIAELPPKYTRDFEDLVSFLLSRER